MSLEIGNKWLPPEVLSTDGVFQKCSKVKLNNYHNQMSNIGGYWIRFHSHEMMIPKVQ